MLGCADKNTYVAFRFSERSRCVRHWDVRLSYLQSNRQYAFHTFFTYTDTLVLIGLLMFVELGYETWHHFDCSIVWIILCSTSRPNRTAHFRPLWLLWQELFIYIYLFFYYFLFYSLCLTSEEGSIRQPKLVMVPFLRIFLYFYILIYVVLHR